MPQQRYTREEVDQILGRAIERERGGDDLSYEQLVAVAGEVGVSAESIEKAAAEITAERGKREELVQVRREAWRGFVGHLIPYVCVNSLLALINYLTTSFPWVLFPLLGWGIGLLSHLLSVAMPNPERLERRLERQRERERRRQLKRQIRSGAKDFEVAVGQGVAALLQAAADRVQQGPQRYGVPRRQRVIDVDPKEDEFEGESRGAERPAERPAERRNRR